MRKFAIAFAALAAFGIAMPPTSSAKAEDTVVIKKDGDRDRDRDRDMHRRSRSRLNNNGLRNGAIIFLFRNAAQSQTRTRRMTRWPKRLINACR
jgi:hypothetical protein